MKILKEMLSLHHLESFYCNIHEFKFQGVNSNKVELRKYMQLLENKKYHFKQMQVLDQNVQLLE